MSNSLKRKFKYLIYILLGIFSPFIFFAGLMLFPIVRNIITGITGVTIGLFISLVLLLVFLLLLVAVGYARLVEKEKKKVEDQIKIGEEVIKHYPNILPKEIIQKFIPIKQKNN